MSNIFLSQVTSVVSEACHIASSAMRGGLDRVNHIDGVSSDRKPGPISAVGLKDLWPHVRDRALRFASSGRTFLGERVMDRVSRLRSQDPIRSEGVAMRNERIFNAGGFYSFVVRSDALIHSGAVRVGREVIGELLQTWPKGKPVRVLDLACGSLPISISEIMEVFGEHTFNYTGVDINPDQVRLAKKEFKFPKNVNTVSLLEGNAWDLDSLGLSGEFDVVFSGLNFHHAVPEELYFLALQLQRYLSRNGVVISHDIYRPNHEVYLRRPRENPHRLGETLVLLPDSTLSAIDMPDFGIAGQGYVMGQKSWRDGFLARLNAYLLSRGALPGDVDVNTMHVLGHDFSVSTNDLQLIFDRAGLTVQVHDYDQSEHPARQHIAVVSARRKYKKRH